MAKGDDIWGNDRAFIRPKIAPTRYWYVVEPAAVVGCLFIAAAVVFDRSNLIPWGFASASVVVAVTALRNIRAYVRRRQAIRYLEERAGYRQSPLQAPWHRQRSRTGLR